MIKKKFGNLRRWLSYSVDFELIPLAKITHELEAWHWLSDDPQIALLPSTSVSLSGYYMLEVEIFDLKQPVNACLYINRGDGFDENCSFLLPIARCASKGRLIKRICYVDGFSKSFRFDPSDEPGSCGDLSIKMIKLTERKARQLMAKKLEASSVGYELLANPSETYRAYDKLFNNFNSTDYYSWITHHELGRIPSDSAISQLKKTPLISIICPTYNTKPEWLISCVESVKNQAYFNWQLILIDDASSNTSHFGVLERYDHEDSRISIIYIEENGHISAATNAGIDLASGQYITFLDHDDELAPNALFEVCKVIESNPAAKIIYSDEDLMSEEGERITPHFKSDWNVELLRAHNYVTHLCCYEAELLNSLGGMRLGYEGAQDYDLILRASTEIDANDIHHIPKILYHWRMVEGSTALSSGAKSYATEAGLKALTDYVKSTGVSADVAHSDRENFYTVSYPLPRNLPKVSIIIPTRDGMEVLKPCIESLLEKTHYSNYEVVILDNGSKKSETLSFLHDLSLKPNFKIIRDEGEFNYSRINNVAVEHSTGELICLLNNDIEIIDRNWLAEMVSLAIRKEVGCVGAKLLYPDGTIQHAGVILGLGGYAAHSHRGIGGSDAGYFCRAQLRQQLSAVTGACLLIKRDVFNKVDGLDEAFQVAYNDVDFCLRVQALGYKNIYTPFATLIHHESKTRGEDTSPEKIKRFEKEKALLLQRWSKIIMNDPFYNANLTRSSEDFSLRA